MAVSVDATVVKIQGETKSLVLGCLTLLCEDLLYSLFGMRSITTTCTFIFTAEFPLTKPATDEAINYAMTEFSNN